MIIQLPNNGYSNIQFQCQEEKIIYITAKNDDFIEIK